MPGQSASCSTPEGVCAPPSVGRRGYAVPGGYCTGYASRHTPAVPGVPLYPGYTTRPHGTAGLYCWHCTAAGGGAENGLSRQGFRKAIAVSGRLQWSAGADHTAGCRDPVWMPVAGHPDSQPRGSPLVGQGVTCPRRGPRVDQPAIGAVGGPSTPDLGIRGHPGPWIPWRGGHELAIADSGRLQPVSGETGKYLLLCSLDLTGNPINTSNRWSRDHLQSATGVADLPGLVKDLAAYLRKDNNRRSRDRLQLSAGADNLLLCSKDLAAGHRK